MRGHLSDLLVAHIPDAVVSEAEDGSSALGLMASIKPDLLIVDLVMPGMNGIEVTRQALSDQPGLRAIVISLHGDSGFFRAALDAGASAYLLKERLFEELVPAVEAVMAGMTLPGPE